jgi:predicted mannosyl-3-phosphoglycerate phosphatase (HAD superfamily)
MYAGRLSLESGDDVALREKYAWELLNMPGREGYDKRQRKFILEFVGRIFRLSDPRISEGLREAYKLQTISLEQYVAEIDKAEARMEGKFEVARSMLADGLPAETIKKYTGLDESSILSLM